MVSSSGGGKGETASSIGSASQISLLFSFGGRSVPLIGTRCGVIVSSVSAGCLQLFSIGAPCQTREQHHDLSEVYQKTFTLVQWFLTLLGALNPKGSTMAFFEPFVVGKIMCFFLHIPQHNPKSLNPMSRRQLDIPFPQPDFSTSGKLKHIRAVSVSKFPLARLESLAFGLLWSVPGYSTWEV